MHICKHCSLPFDNVLEHGQHELCCHLAPPLTGIIDGRVRDLMKVQMRPVVEAIEPLIAGARAIGLDEEADQLEQSIAMYR